MTLPSRDEGSAPRVTLHVARGKSSSTSREMKGKSLLVGSSATCDIQMRSSDVAPKHALITRGEEGVIIRPLDGDHPVEVNGLAITEQRLVHGDSIRLGPFELRVTIEGETPRSALSSSASSIASAMQGLVRLTRPPAPATEPTPAPFVPERLAEIQRSQLEADRELERRRRQLHDELAKIESERAQFKQERSRFETHRHEVERQLRESAARETELARLAQNLDEREKRIAENERAIEASKNALADESIRFDRDREVFDARKLRLLRIRRRLIQQYRVRFERAEGAVSGVAARESKLQQDRAEHEAEVTHWKRVADELGRKQAELKRIEAEIQRRHEALERRESELRDRQSRFENEIAQTHTKDKTLEALRADLDRRKALLAEEETSLRDARKSLEEQFERAKIRSGEIQKRHEETEARRLTLEKQEQYLRDQAAGLEKHRVSLIELDRELATRRAEIDQSHSAMEAVRRQVEAHEAELRIREIALTQSQELLQNKEALLREWETQKEVDEREIGRRMREIEAESERIARQLQDEQQAIEARRQESEELFRSTRQASDAVEDEKDRLLSRLHEAREISAEVAHRESIVHARQRQIDAAEHRQYAERTDLEQRERSLENDRNLIAFDRSRLDQESAESRDRLRVIQAEVTRLRELSVELERRQQVLLTRETKWSEEVALRKEQWQQLADELTRRQDLLDRQASAQTQRVQKLKDLTSRLFGRSPRVEQKAEAVKGAHEAQVEQIQSAQASQHALMERLKAEVELIDQQAVASAESMKALYAQRDELARMKEQVDLAVPGADSIARRARADMTDHERTASENATLLSLEKWSKQMAQAIETIQRRSSEIDAGQQNVSSVEALIKPPPATPPTAAPVVDRWQKARQHSDDDIARVLLSAGLVESSKLQWLSQSAATRGHRLLDEIARQRTISPFQLESLLAGKPQGLQLGQAKILDQLHEGSVATTYLIQMPNETQPTVARMLRPMWSRDPARRRQYEIVLESLQSFRHPNIVAGRGAMMVGDRFGSRTEYVPSVPLSTLVGLPFPAGSLLAIGHQALAGIASAERAGFAHRSLRPSRILLAPGGQVQLLGYAEPDWLRRVHLCEKAKSIQPYASPEVLAVEQNTDARADVYSIGAILSELLFRATGTSSLRTASLREEYPPAILDLIESMVSASPGSRPRAHEAMDVFQESADPQSLVDWPDLAMRWEDLPVVGLGRMAA